MGLFDIFKKPVYEKYGELIYALKEQYQSLRITKAEASVFSMSTNHCGNIDNLNITIYRGNAFNEHPAEYKSLYYDDYVFVKTTYSINGEAIAISNAFPKDGNQFMMFTSIIGAEIMKTNYTMELQQKKEEELKKAAEEDEKRMQEIFFQKMREKGLTVDEEKIKAEYEKLCNEVYDGSKDYEIDSLTTEQKYALLGLAVSFYFTFPNMQYKDEAYKTLSYFTSILKLDKVFLIDFIEHKNSLAINKFVETVKDIHKDGPLINFIFTCKDLMSYMDNEYYTAITYTQMLHDIGFSQEDIEATLNNKYNFRFSDYKEETQTIIVQTWSLLDFAKEYGPKVHIANCINNKTGDKFKCVVFGEEDNRTFVTFSSKLGELTAKEMIERKHQLKVKKWSKDKEEGFTLYE